MFRSFSTRTRTRATLLGIVSGLLHLSGVAAVRTTELQAAGSSLDREEAPAASLDVSPTEQEPEILNITDIGGNLDPDVDGVACEALKYWWKSDLVSKTPDKVRKLMDKQKSMKIYEGLCKDLLTIPTRFPGRWDTSKIHRFMHDKGKYTSFRNKGIEVIIMQKGMLIGSDLRLCFVDLKKYPSPKLNHTYSDAKNPMGEQLPRGVVSIHLDPPIYTDHNQTDKEIGFSKKPSTNLLKFLHLNNLGEAHKELGKEVQIKLDKPAESVALTLLDKQISFEEKFKKEGVKLYACYKRRPRFPWGNISLLWSVGNADHYNFWIEYVKLSEQPSYLPIAAILQERQCELLPSPNKGMTLEVRALIQLHNLLGKYMQMHRTLRLLLRDGSISDPGPIYRTLWNGGFDDYFLNEGIKLYLQKSLGSSPARWSLCYQDIHKVTELPEDRYIDGKIIRTAIGGQKRLPHSVVGENLLESKQKLVFGEEAPVEVMRLLTAKKAAALHKEMTKAIRTLPASTYGRMVEDVHDEIKKDFTRRFWSKGIAIYVCTRMHAIEYEGFNTGFTYFNWIEYVDLTPTQAMPAPLEYKPPERVYDPDESEYETLPKKDEGGARSNGPLWAAYTGVSILLLRMQSR